MISNTGPAGRAAKAPAKSGATLLGALSRIACETLSPLLEEMFEGCDTILSELASGSRNNLDEHLYLDSLREIRHKKAGVVAEFRERIMAGFVALENRRATPEGDTVVAVTADTLELIGQDQIEKQLLIADMVSKARVEWQKVLFQLHQRMLAIAPCKFSELENPLDPGRIASAFLEACQPIELDRKILKILFNQFDAGVLRELDEHYQRSNQILVDARVLPDLAPLGRRTAKKYELPAKTPPPASARTTAASAGTVQQGHSGAGGVATDGSSTAFDMSELTQLLQRLRGASGARLPMFAQAAPAQTVAAVANDELVSLLAEFQAQSSWLGAGDLPPVDIRNALDAIASNRGQLNLGQADEDVINIVTMFFDMILDDRNIPAEIQALTNRLQLPILKIALKDRTFFTDREHPARRLLNEIARIGIGWESRGKDGQDAVFVRLGELVAELQQDSSSHAESFEKCLSALKEHVDRSEQRAAKLERRAMEKAQAEARTTAARETVRKTLHQRLDGLQLPESLSTFLIEEWQQVMQLIALRKGTEGADWVSAVKTVDDLVWSAQAPQTEAARGQLERLLPDLYERLTSGLGNTQGYPEDSQSRIETVREVHSRLLVPAEDTTEPVPVPVAALTTAQKAKIQPVRESAESAWPEATAADTSRVQPEGLLFESLKRADDIATGTWFEYDDLRRETTRRCKLSARIEETRMFMFSDRQGMPVCEKPRKAFAYDLQMGHARVIEDTPLFDRTFERITGSLRKLAGDS